MAKPTALVTSLGGAFASVAGQIVPMVASKFLSGYSGGTREYLGGKSLNYLLNNLFAWTNYLDGFFDSSDNFILANKNIIISGTGDIKHGNRQIMIPAAAFNAVGQTAITTPQNVSGGGVVGGAWRNWAAAPNNAITASLPLRVGDRLLAIDWYYNKVSNATQLNLQALYTTVGSGGSTAAISNFADTSTGASEITHSSTGINYTLVTTQRPFLEVSASSAFSSMEFYGCLLTYDRP